MQSTSESVAAKLPDDVWQVIKDHLLKYKGYEAPDELRHWLNENTIVELFDGGAFLSKGNEFDLFVVPEKRGRWQIRTVFGNYLNKMGRTHGKIMVRINEQNMPSLRLARGFGFKEVSRENGTIRLENDSWAT